MDACTDVFVASTDQSHWRQEIVIWVSTCLAIAPPRRESCGQFIRSEANVKGAGVRSAELMSCYNRTRPSSGRCALTEWPLRDAKNKFSALVNAALAGEPQLVTRRGQPAVVVLAADEYERLRLLDNAGASTLGELLFAIPQDGDGFERMSIPARFLDDMQKGQSPLRSNQPI